MILKKIINLVFLVIILATCVFAPENGLPEEYDNWADYTKDKPDEAYQKNPQEAVKTNPNLLDNPNKAEDYFKRYPDEVTNSKLRSKAAVYLIKSDNPDQTIMKGYVTTSSFDSTKDKVIAGKYFSSNTDNIKQDTALFSKYSHSEGITITFDEKAELSNLLSYSSDGTMEFKTEPQNQKINLKEFKDDYEFEVDSGGIHFLLRGNDKQFFTGEIKKSLDGKGFDLDEGTIGGQEIKNGKNLQILRKKNSYAKSFIIGTAKNFGGIEFEQQTYFKLTKINKLLNRDYVKIPRLEFPKGTKIIDISDHARVVVESKDNIELPFKSKDNPKKNMILNSGEIFFDRGKLRLSNSATLDTLYINPEDYKNNPPYLYIEGTKFSKPDTESSGFYVHLKDNGLEAKTTERLTEEENKQKRSSVFFNEKITISPQEGNPLFHMYVREYAKDSNGNLIKLNPELQDQGYQGGPNGFAYKLAPDYKSKNGHEVNQDYLDITIKNGDMVEVLSRKKEGLIPQVEISGDGETIVKNGRIRLEYDNKGQVLEPYDSNAIFQSVACDLVTKKQSDQRLQDKIYRFSSGGSFGVVDENNQVIVQNKYAGITLKLSDRLYDNEFQTFDDLRAAHPDKTIIIDTEFLNSILNIVDMSTDVDVIKSPGFIVTVDYLLKNNQKLKDTEIIALIPKYHAVQGLSFNAYASTGRIMGLGEEMFDASSYNIDEYEQNRNQGYEQTINHEDGHNKGMQTTIREAEYILKKVAKGEIKLNSGDIKTFTEKYQQILDNLKKEEITDVDTLKANFKELNNVFDEVELKQTPLIESYSQDMNLIINDLNQPENNRQIIDDFLKKIEDDVKREVDADNIPFDNTEGMKNILQNLKLSFEREREVITNLEITEQRIYGLMRQLETVGSKEEKDIVKLEILEELKQASDLRERSEEIKRDPLLVLGGMNIRESDELPNERSMLLMESFKDFSKLSNEGMSNELLMKGLFALWEDAQQNDFHDAAGVIKQTFSNKYDLDPYILRNYVQSEGDEYAMYYEVPTVGFFEKTEEQKMKDVKHPHPYARQFYRNQVQKAFDADHISIDEYKKYFGIQNVPNDRILKDHTCIEYKLTCCEKYPESVNC